MRFIKFGMIFAFLALGAVGCGITSGLGPTLVGPRPPTATGTLTSGQKAAAGQAVTAFWAALALNDMRTVVRTVLPAQRACAKSGLAGGVKMTVTSFRIVSVEPAGTGRAVVRYQINAKSAQRGNSMMSGFLAQGVEPWLSVTERAGHWYVNLGAGAFPGGACSGPGSRPDVTAPSP